MNNNSMCNTLGLDLTRYEDVIIANKNKALRKLNIEDILHITDNCIEQYENDTKFDIYACANYVSTLITPKESLDSLCKIKKEIILSVDDITLTINNLTVKDAIDIIMNMDEYNVVKGHGMMKSNTLRTIKRILEISNSDMTVTDFTTVSQIKDIVAQFEKEVDVSPALQLFQLFQDSEQNTI